MFRALLIDIDDTLLDFHAYVRESMQYGFEKYGLGAYTEEKYQTFRRINKGLWQQIETGELTFCELKKNRWNLVFRELGISFDGEEFEAFFRGRLYDSAILIPGAREFLDAVHGHHILCAASNGPFAQQKHRLEIGGLLPLFEHVFISEEIGASKPSREFFDTCLSRLSRVTDSPISREEILMIGDSATSDIRGGMNAGIKTCYFNPDYKPLPEGIRADFEADSFREILKIVKGTHV